MKQKKYIISVGLLILMSTFFVSHFSYGDEDTCKYRPQIEMCKNSQSPRAIEDFVCIAGSEEDIAYQIVLDDTFSEIDDKIDVYLTQVEKNKNYYFGIDASKNLVDGVNDMFGQFSIHGYFWKEFKKVCSEKIIKETISCLPEEKTSIIQAKKYLIGENDTCMALAEKKLEISKQVALNILNLNKYQVRKDQMKLYVQEERSKYNDLLDSMMVHLGYMERIMQKWPQKIKTGLK